MNQLINHGPVRRWRKGWFRVRCRCGADSSPCPAVLAQQRQQEAVTEVRAWRDEQRRARGYEASVDNWWENPR